MPELFFEALGIEWLQGFQKSNKKLYVNPQNRRTAYLIDWKQIPVKQTSKRRGQANIRHAFNNMAHALTIAMCMLLEAS